MLTKQMIERGWVALSAGRYLHTPTGVEVIKGSAWGVRVPLLAEDGAWHSAGLFITSMWGAIRIAESAAIPQMRDRIEAAHTEALRENAREHHADPRTQARIQRVKAYRERTHRELREALAAVMDEIHTEALRENARRTVLSWSRRERIERAELRRRRTMEAFRLARAELADANRALLAEIEDGPRGPLSRSVPPELTLPVPEAGLRLLSAPGPY